MTDLIKRLDEIDADIHKPCSGGECFPDGTCDFHEEMSDRKSELDSQCEKIARAAADRPWMARDTEGRAFLCHVCTRDQVRHGAGHFDFCSVRELDAALDAAEAGGV